MLLQLFIEFLLFIAKAKIQADEHIIMQYIYEISVSINASFRFADI